MHTSLAILGAGAMGTAVAQTLAMNGHAVRLWDYNTETVQTIRRSRENPFLPGIRLHRRITAHEDMATAVADISLIIIAAASPFVRGTTKRLAPLLRGQRGIIVAHVAKGLEQKTNATMHEVIQSELPATLRPLVVTLSGPSLAGDLVRGVPTGMIAASASTRAAAFVQRIFTGSPVHITPARDTKGVSLCGSLKNVYAIALGMCDGMRLSMNAKALLFTIALQEMTTIIVALGGKHATLLGLAGVGDLVVTGLGDGRNRSLGERICRDGHCRFVLKEKNTTWEGVDAAKHFYVLVARRHITAPLLATVYRVLHRNANPCTALTRFLKNL